MIDKNKQQLDISQKKPVDNKQINNQLHNVLGLQGISLSRNQQMIFDFLHTTDFPNSSPLWDEENAEFYANEVVKESGDYGATLVEKSVLLSSQVADFLDTMSASGLKYFISYGSGTGQKERWVLSSLTPEQRKKMTYYFVDSSSKNTEQACLLFDKEFPGQSKDLVGYNGDLIKSKEAFADKANKLIFYGGQSIGNLPKEIIQDTFRNTLNFSGDKLLFTCFTLPQTQEEIQKSIVYYDNELSERFVKNGIIRHWESEKDMLFSEDIADIVNSAMYHVLYDESDTTIKIGLRFTKNFSVTFPFNSQETGLPYTYTCNTHEQDVHWLHHVHFSKRFSLNEIDETFAPIDLERELTVDLGGGVMAIVMNNKPLIEKNKSEKRLHILMCFVFFRVIGICGYQFLADPITQTKIHKKKKQGVENKLASLLGREAGVLKLDSFAYESMNEAYETVKQLVKKRIEERFRLIESSNGKITEEIIDDRIALALQEDELKHIANSYGYGWPIKACFDLTNKILQDNEENILNAGVFNLYPYHFYKEYFDDFIYTISCVDSNNLNIEEIQELPGNFFCHNSLFENSWMLGDKKKLIVAKVLNGDNSVLLAQGFGLDPIKKGKIDERKLKDGRNVALSILEDASPRMNYIMKLYLETYSLSAGLIDQKEHLSLGRLMLQNLDVMPLFSGPRIERDERVTSRYLTKVVINPDGRSPLGLDDEIRAKIARLLYFSVKSNKNRFLWKFFQEKENIVLAKETLKYPKNKELLESDYHSFICYYTSYITGKKYKIYKGKMQNTELLFACEYPVQDNYGFARNLGSTNTLIDLMKEWYTIGKEVYDDDFFGNVDNSMKEKISL